MSSNSSLFPLLAAGVTGFALVAAIFISPSLALADEAKSQAPSCSCPQSENRPSKPKLAGLEAPLDETDEQAALESVQYALSEVADGSSYVWHRSHGRLSGLVKPTGSFKDQSGNICRHILVVLNASDATKKTEAVACRLTSGVWQLDGS